MNGKILFVTYHDENFDEGLSYAVDLAKTMSDGIEILMIYKRKVLEKLDDMMVAVSFAEEGEYRTAREIISEDYKKHNEDYEKKISLLTERCSRSGIAVAVSASASETVSAIKNILSQNARIDMVLLSPSITSGGNVTSRELNKLVKTASRPVVTMSRNARVA